MSVRRLGRLVTLGDAKVTSGLGLTCYAVSEVDLSRTIEFLHFDRQLGRTAP